MSRVGKKPIALPAGVKVELRGNLVAVQGPKCKIETYIPSGIKLETKDGQLLATRSDDKQAPFHGLVRALVFNAVEGVTKGWSKELEIVGIQVEWPILDKFNRWQAQAELGNENLLGDRIGIFLPPKPVTIDGQQ